MNYRRALFIFRRDLRLEDNRGLHFACQNAASVIPAFIFTPTQIEKNHYLSFHALQFMLESLEELAEEIKKRKGELSFFWAEPEMCVEECIRKAKIDAVIVNADYTPYSRKRDKRIETVCKNYGIPFHSFDDALLHAPEEILKETRKPYIVFTPYFKKASPLPVPLPQHNAKWNFHPRLPFARSETILKQLLPPHCSQEKGGRKAALQLLKKKNAHTLLSPHLKFTTCSVREAYHALRAQPEILRQLHWRDFFTQIAYFFPHVFEGPFRKKYENIPWSTDKKAFKRWCEGTTGFPIVDAGMREMNATGRMSNRLRMVTASFLTKDLHLNWQWGEKYFAQKLIDYDPSLNNGNWQWVASTGCDCQPYFRIFNPWLQQKKHDPEHLKCWIPELGTKNYPAPMVDHTIEAAKAINMYR